MFKIQFEIKSKMTAYVWAISGYDRLLKNSWHYILPTATVPIKMHLVEDHAVQWAAAYHVGYGLLGEQGAESIHAKFTQLSLAFVSIKRPGETAVMHRKGTFAKH